MKEYESTSFVCKNNNLEDTFKFIVLIIIIPILIIYVLLKSAILKYVKCRSSYSSKGPSMEEGVKVTSTSTATEKLEINENQDII